MPEGRPLGEVFFEFTTLGGFVKVTAIHAETGIEVSAVGPTTAMQCDLERLAVQKLRRKLAQNV